MLIVVLVSIFEITDGIGLIYLMFFLFGFSFFINGAHCLYKCVILGKKLKYCREISGKILSYYTNVDVHYNQFNNLVITHSYTPIIEYEYNGETKIYISSVDDNIQSALGTLISLYIDENGKIIDKREYSFNRLLGMILTISGAAFLIIEAAIKMEMRV